MCLKIMKNIWQRESMATMTVPRMMKKLWVMMIRTPLKKKLSIRKL